MYSCINIINVQGAPAATSVVTVCKNGRIIIISDTSASSPLCLLLLNPLNFATYRIVIVIYLVARYCYYYYSIVCNGLRTRDRFL